MEKQLMSEFRIKYKDEKMKLEDKNIEEYWDYRRDIDEKTNEERI